MKVNSPRTYLVTRDRIDKWKKSGTVSRSLGTSTSRGRKMKEARQFRRNFISIGCARVLRRGVSSRPSRLWFQLRVSCSTSFYSEGQADPPRVSCMVIVYSSDGN